MAARYKDCVEELLRRLAFGETLKSICMDSRMPTAQTIYGWRMPGHRLYKPGFAERLEAARLMQREYLTDRLLDVGRDAKLSEAQRKAETDAIKAVLGRLGSGKTGVVAASGVSGEVVVRVVYEED